MLWFRLQLSNSYIDHERWALGTALAPRPICPPTATFGPRGESLPVAFCFLYSPPLRPFALGRNISDHWIVQNHVHHARDLQTRPSTASNLAVEQSGWALPRLDSSSATARKAAAWASSCLPTLERYLAQTVSAAPCSGRLNPVRPGSVIAAKYPVTIESPYSCAVPPTSSAIRHSNSYPSVAA